MSGKRLNYKLISVFILLIFLSVLLSFHKADSKEFIKSILEWNNLNFSIWISFIVCFFIHYLSIRNDKTYDGGLIYKHFGKFADSAFAVGTYGLASTTSTAILKGVYSQQFLHEKIYFNNFDQIDIYSMLVVCIFLLAYSIYAAVGALLNAFLISQAESAIPINTK